MTRVGVVARNAAFLWHALTVRRRQGIFPSPLEDLEGEAFLDVPQERLRDIHNKFKIGKFNILIVGRSGAGKSTLVNEIFEDDFAATSPSEPITMETRKYTRQGAPLAIYDTRGLELKKCDQILNELLTFVERNQREENPRERIHMVWLCITEDGRRVEEAEKELTRRLNQFIPVIGVITKVRADRGFQSAVQQLLPEAKNVVRVRAIEENLDGGYALPPEGLENLIEATAQALPEGEVLRTFASVQKSLNFKRKQAQKDVTMATLLAAEVGMVPVALASEVLLVPIQVGMFVAISRTFGIKEASAEFWASLLASLATRSLVGSTTGVKSLGSALKFIPGLGTLTGGVLLSSSSAILTRALGNWYIRFLFKEIQDSGGILPPLEVIREEFKKVSSEFQRGNFKIKFD